MIDEQLDGAEFTTTIDSWTFDLPIEMRSNEAELRATAANLLNLASVRSVIIDGGRRKVVARLDGNRSVDSDLRRAPPFISPATATLPDAMDDGSTSVATWTDPRDQSLCFIKLPARARGWRRWLLLVAAGAALLLGLVGIVLPGLPTTPFVLVASYCLLRSSPGLHGRLLQSRLFGGVLHDWHLHRGIRSHVRYKALAVVALVLGISLFLTAIPLMAKIVILAVAACGIAYIWRLPNVAG